jgi:hypothetical protein
MSIWERLAAATSNLTVGSPLAGLLARNEESQDAANRVELSEQLTTRYLSHWESEGRFIMESG